ncbi:MAG: peptidylprolyl isomerase [Eubacterium sp.]|nr:peptidylprolyl isomerase [Eubacterium sp.]
MAKELENDKLAAKREQAEAKKQELADQIADIKAKILESNDENEKKTLRKQRDELVKMRDGIVITDDKVTVPMAAKAKKALTACIVCVVIVALLVTYVATGAVRHGLIARTGLPQRTITGVVLTDDKGVKHNIKVATYNYYYATYYNSLYQTGQMFAQYGTSDSNSYPDFDEKLSAQTYTDDDGNVMTWEEHFRDEVLENIKDTYMYYYAALAANNGEEPEIKESQQESIDDAIASYEESGATYGFTVDGYLQAVIGSGINEAFVRHEMKVTYIAQNYLEDFTKELSNKEYTDEEYNAYYSEHEQELQSVDIMHFEAESEDEAAEFVAALNDDGSNFAELAYSYSGEETDQDPVELTYYNMTYGTMENLSWDICTAEEVASEEEEAADEETEEEHTHAYPGLDYLFSSERQAGEKFNDTKSVIYIIKPTYLSDVTPVTVRHILITPDDMKPEEEETDEETTEEATEETEDTTEELSDEELDALAAEKAQAVLDEYLAGEQTEDAFAALAKENSSDGNAEDGGIYENVVPNQMVNTFNAWCFDANRQAGDTEIVKTEYGYHVMYFVSKSELPVWKYTAQQALAAEDSDSDLDAFDEANTVKTSWLGTRFMNKDTDISN